MKQPSRKLRLLAALAALTAAGAGGVPAHAQSPLPDAFPSLQAQVGHAEFLLQAPPPSSPTAGTVCVIDTGVSPLPDLGDRVVERIAIDGGSPDDIDHHPDDPTSGHGSFVAGTIASQVDGKGSAGIWPHARIISVRVFGEDRDSTSTAYAAAITECKRQGRYASVINLSLGGPATTSLELSILHDRLNQARGAGLNVVASAGNSGGAVGYPARFPEVLAVGASNREGSLCAFSSLGPELDLSAFGCNLRLTSFSGAAERFAGSSFAAPTVSAVLAALRAYKPSLTVAEAEALLVDHADRTASGPVLNAAAAFRAAGLESLVDAYRAPNASLSTDFLATGGSAAAAVTPSASPSAVRSEVRVDAPVVHASEAAPAGLSRPAVRWATYKRRFLRVTLKNVPAGADVKWRIGSKSITRSSASLRVRVARRSRVTVCFEDQWGDRTPITVVNLRR